MKQPQTSATANPPCRRSAQMQTIFSKRNFAVLLFLQLICWSVFDLAYSANATGSWELPGAVHRLGMTSKSGGSGSGVIKAAEAKPAGSETKPAVPKTKPSPSPSKSQFSLANAIGPICFGGDGLSDPKIVSCQMEKAAPRPVPPPAKKTGVKMLKAAEAAPQQKGALNIDLTCRADQKLCDNARQALDTASLVLGNVLVLDAPLAVNATVMHFCEEIHQCGGTFQLLGGASPARTMLLKDNDTLWRIYPQALVKQLSLPQHPSYDRYDITAQFNADGNFWFEGDGPIQSKQSDFLFVAIHEMIHGLGFTSSWADYVNEQPRALTPDPLPDGTINDPDAVFEFNGFFESAFDRFLVDVPTMNYTSNVTRQLNNFNGGIGTQYTNQIDFIDKLTRAPEYRLAGEMFNMSTARGHLGFMPKDAQSADDVILLETGLQEGFVQASSISHVDYTKYTNTPDFLMRYLQDPGTLLKDDILTSGDFAGGPIGPDLLRILETLGYRINKNPTKLAMEMNAEESSSVSKHAVRWSGMAMTLIAAVFFALA